jgi:hypothetical protein
LGTGGALNTDQFGGLKMRVTRLGIELIEPRCRYFLKNPGPWVLILMDLNKESPVFIALFRNLMGSEHREPGLFSTRGRILWTFFFEVFPYVSLNLVLFYPDVPDLDRSGQIVHLIDEDNIYIYTTG